MKFQVSSDEAIERTTMGFLNETRTCEFKRDLAALNVGGQILGPFKTGDSVTLPNWAIEKLSERDYVQVHIQNAYDSTRNVDILHNREQKQKHSTLEDFPPFFYVAVNRKIARLQRDKTSLDPVSVDDIERLDSRLKSLIEMRQPKIMRAAVSRSCFKWQSHMTNEEKWLCNRLSETLLQWHTKITE